MLELLEKAKAYIRGREEKKASDFDALVKAVADGKAPDPAKIAEQLEAFGKTVEDLAAAVENRQRRAEYARRFAELPGLQRKLADLQKAGSAEAARFRPLEEEHAATVRRLSGEAYFLEQQITEAQGMNDKLLGSYQGSLRAELAVNAAEQNEINQTIRSVEATAQAHEEAAEYTDLDDDRVTRTAAAKGCRQTAAERKKALPALVARQAAIMQAMLVS
jgi:hypothetical protein